MIRSCPIFQAGAAIPSLNLRWGCRPKCGLGGWVPLRTTEIWLLEAIQELLLKIALQAAREDHETRRERQRQGIELAKEDKRYRGRKADDKRNANIVAHRNAGKTITETAELAGCSVAHVKRIWRARQELGARPALLKI